MTDLLDPVEGLARILAVCRPAEVETLAPMAAMGRVVATTVTSPCDLPPFDNAAMDGFALGGGDGVLLASSAYPVRGEQAAGDPASRGGDGAWEIMTGACLPGGLDRVIPVERTERLHAPERVRLLASVRSGENVRRAGSDVGCGETVLTPGTLLAPHHLMLLAALGTQVVEVRAQPKVAVLTTGRELVDDPSRPLASGQIRNSNGPYLAARLPLAGARLVYAATLGDAIEPFLQAVATARAAGAGVVLSTGAVSMGRYDFVPQALATLGAEVLFHKLAIRPGKPLLCARLPDGALFFGLPGNPMATATGLRFFVEPALRAMLGLPPEQPLRVPLVSGFRSDKPVRLHLKARLETGGEGRLHIRLLPGQESYRIRTLTQANAWAVVPVGRGEFAPGDLVDVFGLGHLDILSSFFDGSAECPDGQKPCRP